MPKGTCPTEHVTVHSVSLATSTSGWQRRNRRLGRIRSASRHHDPRLPRPGTILTRTFRDQNITVQVLEKGFEYEGKVYRSLSAVARQISGTQWNGFSFFRLHAVGGAK